MSTSTENRLHKVVTIPEMDVSISQLIDILEFSRDRHDEIQSEIRILEQALKTEYADRQSWMTKNGIELAIKEATSECYDWCRFSTRMQNILSDALTE
jgi:hypothetical protein